MRKRKKTITNSNEKGQDHGYQEFYVNNKLLLRVCCKNNQAIGYEEQHYFKETTYYIR